MRASIAFFVEPAGAKVLQHPFGIHMAGRDRIDAQPLPRPFDRHGPGQALERRLGRRIEPKAGYGPAGGDAADVDDRAARADDRSPICANARAPFNGPTALTAKKRAASAASDVDQRRSGKGGGVVDEDVDRAEAIDGRRHHPLAVPGVLATSAATGSTAAAHSFSIAAAARASVSWVRPAIATRAPLRAKARAIA